MASVPERLAALEAKQEVMLSDVAEIKSDVKNLLALAAKGLGRSSYRAELVSIAAVGVALASLASRFIPIKLT